MADFRSGWYISLYIIVPGNWWFMFPSKCSGFDNIMVAFSGNTEPKQKNFLGATALSGEVSGFTLFEM